MTGRLITLGEALGIFRTDRYGTLVHLNTASVATGGAEGNVAIAAARLGARATWIGRVGDDSFGLRIVREMRAEGVDVRVSVDRDAPTGLLIKEFDQPGYTTITYHRRDSAGSRISPEDLDGIDLTRDDVLHLTGITPAISDSARATVFRALSLASAAGSKISYDVNHRNKLWPRDDAQSVHREILTQAHVAFAGTDEAKLVLGEDRHDDPAWLAQGIAKLGPSEVIVKCGADGARAFVDGVHLCQPAHPLSEVVDTVGAGDAFVGAYLADRMFGRSAPVALLAATQAGAAACLSLGDWEGSPRRRDLEMSDRPDPVAR